jgi:hypothetical protein
MQQTNAQAKYIAVNIPIKLKKRIEKLVNTKGSFITPTDYVTYALRVIVSQWSDEDTCELFSSHDLYEIRTRLVALGSL